MCNKYFPKENTKKEDQTLLWTVQTLTYLEEIFGRITGLQVNVLTQAYR